MNQPFRFALVAFPLLVVACGSSSTTNTPVDAADAGPDAPGPTPAPDAGTDTGTASAMKAPECQVEGRTFPLNTTSLSIYGITLGGPGSLRFAKVTPDVVMADLTLPELSCARGPTGKTALSPRTIHTTITSNGIPNENDNTSSACEIKQDDRDLFEFYESSSGPFRELSFTYMLSAQDEPFASTCTYQSTLDVDVRF